MNFSQQLKMKPIAYCLILWLTHAALARRNEEVRVEERQIERFENLRRDEDTRFDNRDMRVRNILERSDFRDSERRSERNMNEDRRGHRILRDNRESRRERSNRQTIPLSRKENAFGFSFEPINEESEKTWTNDWKSMAMLGVSILAVENRKSLL